MRKKIVHAVVALLLFGLAGCDVTKKTDANSGPKPLPTIVAKTQGMQAMPGYFPIYWDGKEGKVWLEIGRFDSEFLYVVSLASGVGSNDIGLDRGQFGDLEITASPEHVVKFDRVGSKVLLIEQNLALSRSDEESGGKARGRTVVCSLCPLGIQSRGGRKWARPGRCHVVSTQ